MSTTLFEAPSFDPERERRKKAFWVAALVVVAILAFFAYRFRNWPEEHVVERFFEALAQKQYEKAYEIWVADPNWKQHASEHSAYSFPEFYADWGPSGEWGVIQSFHIDGSVAPKQGSGVVVVVSINHRVGKKANIWVERKDKSLSFSPVETTISRSGMPPGQRSDG